MISLARRKSSPSLRRQALEASAVTPSQTTVDKSLPYRDPRYQSYLRDKGSFLYESDLGVTDACKATCQALLDTTQSVPQDSLFRDDLFQTTCRNIEERNEARVVDDIGRLIVPSAENLTTYGAVELKHLIVNINECWSESIPVTDTRPQPDFSVGFKRSAFTEDQLRKLKPHTGDVSSKWISFFLATWRMYFPFFACEAKSQLGEIYVADKQNAHSMTVAVRGIVELFKLVKRENELHRKILAFSISYDNKTVRIYGHYAMIHGSEATFYRHPIHTFDFTAQDGKEKWTAYRFTKNVYFNFMPNHHKFICSAIDDLPIDPVPQIPLGNSLTSIASTDVESELADSQEMATSSPASQLTGSNKKPRLTANAMLKQDLDLQRQENERQKQENERQKQEHDRQMMQMNLQLNQFISQLQGLSGAGSRNELELRTMVRSLERNLEQHRTDAKQREDRLREESKQELEESKRELAREKEESKRQHSELLEQIHELNRKNTELMDMLRQRLR